MCVTQAIKAWLELLRLPNLLTVPGDVLAGFWLAGALGWPGARLLYMLASSLLFYAGGLLLNDAFDYVEDCRERPGRPLPQGAIPRRVVFVIGGGLLALAVVLCFLVGGFSRVAGACLGVCIVAYDAGGKRYEGVGPLLMGACRGLNLVLGASVVLSAMTPLIWAAAAVLTLYIAAVTAIARHETCPEDMGRVRSYPVGVVAGGLLVVACFAQPHTAASRWGLAVSAGLALLVALKAACDIIALSLRRREQLAEAACIRDVARLCPLALDAKPEDGIPPAALAPMAGALPARVGALVGNLLFLQAALCFAADRGRGSWLCAAGLCVLWPLHRWLGRWFYAS